MLGDQSSDARSKPATFRRLAAFWRYLGGPCAKWLLYRPELPDQGRLDAGTAFSRDCPGGQMVAAPSQASLGLFAVDGERLPLARLVLDPNLGGQAFQVIDAMLEAGAVGSEGALRAIMAASGNGDLRLAVARKLRELGASGADAMSYRLPNRPDLDRELLRWLARSDPHGASRQSAALIKTGAVDSNLLGVLALIHMDDSDRTDLLAFAGTQSAIPHTIIEAVLDPVPEAARLLVGPDQRIRALAQGYVLAREDASAVLTLARRFSHRADVGLVRSEARLGQIETMRDELAAMPDFVLSWRAQWMDHSEIYDPASSLAFERHLDIRRDPAHSLR